MAPLANKYRFMGLPASHWSKPLKLNCPTSLAAAAGSHLQYCSILFVEVHFQVWGFGRARRLLKINEPKFFLCSCGSVLACRIMQLDVTLLLIFS